MRLIACFAVTLFAFCGTIKHIMFEGVRPFDWLMLGIEALVVVLILYELIAETIRRRREHRRQAGINLKVVVLSELVDKGVRLQSVVPDETITSDHRITAKWLEDVEAWTTETNEYLLLHSKQASDAFLLSPNVVLAII